MPVQKICDSCGIEFTTRARNRFCSTKCNYDYKRTGKTMVEHVCVVCGKNFQEKVSTPRKTCSKDCSYELKRINGTSFIKACLECGIDFRTYKCDERHYCKQDCYNAAMKKRVLTTNCPWCKREFQYHQSWPRIFCSSRCAIKGRISKRKLVGDLYYGLNWDFIRKLVRKRDKVCRICNMTPQENKKQLSVHHIIPFRIFGKSRYREANNPENLMAVCVKCHHIAEAYSRELYPFE